MNPCGADGQRGNGKGKGNALPSDYVPSGGVSTNMRDSNTLGGSLSGSPALNAAASGQPLDAESLKAELETLRLRLTAQQATNRSLARANDELIVNVEAMRQEDIESDARPTESRGKTKSKTKVKPDPKGGESSSSRPDPVGQATERRDQERKLRKKSLQIRKETKLAHSTSSVENANMSAAHESSSSSGTTSSSSSESGESPGSPSSPSSSSSSESSDMSSDAASRRSRLGPYKSHPDSKKWLEKADRLKVIRPSNSRFKSLLDYPTYFLIRRDLSLPPSLVEKTHKMSRRLDGAFQGQEPFTGTSPLGVFTFLTTFRRACDAAGVTHGQAFPLLAFRLSGAAKRAFSSALNSKAGHRTYAIRTYGAAINWLLAKYATHAVMASAYQNIITMRQPDNESPTAFGLRVETQCDRLDGLFHAQDVKDVFINGLSEIIQAHVRVLDGQFPKRTLADTISAAQMYWDGTNKLRLSLKLPRLQTTKVAYASPMPTRHTNVDRRFQVTQPRARSRSPPPKESPQARTDICYNCNKPGHFAARCAEPYRPRERRPPVIAVNSVTEDTKPTAESDSNESTDSKNE